MPEVIQTLLSYISEDQLISLFQEYAYRPFFVYTFIIAFMTASSFGVPIPEEVVLVSAGLVAFMAANPADFPPPEASMHGVNIYLLMFVCFMAVIGSDLLIYGLGRVFGTRLLHTKFFRKKVGVERLNKIDRWFQKYGYWASGAFRFLPGIRFPGHMSCGILRIPIWKFLMVDGGAAMISVPTQVYIVSLYGEEILQNIKTIKLVFIIIILVLVVTFLLKYFLFNAKKKNMSIQ